MSKYLYHGSIVDNIEEMLPNSIYHSNSSKSVVYMTESKPYSLFYIWDGKKNKREKKWITCYIKDGVVHYEEQFTNQLEKFYNGVSGFIYTFELDTNMTKAREESMWISFDKVDVVGKIRVPNVYEQILQYEKQGKVVVHRYDQLSKKGKTRIDSMMTKYILDKDLLNRDDELSNFIKDNHVNAWTNAKKTF